MLLTLLTLLLLLTPTTTLLLLTLLLLLLLLLMLRRWPAIQARLCSAGGFKRDAEYPPVGNYHFNAYQSLIEKKAAGPASGGLVAAAMERKAWPKAFDWES